MKKKLFRTLLFCTGLAVTTLSQIGLAPCPPFGELTIDDKSTQHMGGVLYKASISGHDIDDEIKTKGGGTISGDANTQSTKAGAKICIKRNHGIVRNNWTEYHGEIPFPTDRNIDIKVTLHEGGRLTVAKIDHLKEAQASSANGIASYVPGVPISSFGHAVTAAKHLSRGVGQMYDEVNDELRKMEGKK